MLIMIILNIKNMLFSNNWHSMKFDAVNRKIFEIE